MNSGIYSLYWWEQDLIYVGLSQNLNARKAEHFRDLENNTHTNYKVQNAYNLYGKPDFIILEYCDIKYLPEKEIYWCSEFNALGSNGLCIVEPGIVGFGVNSNASKYSKNLILKIFSLLYTGKCSVPNISNRLRVPIHLVRDICSGRTHIWLSETYPQKYAKMLSIDRLKLSKLSSIRLLKDAEGIVYQINNIREFCRNILGNENHHSNICKVLNGTRKVYKGYTL